MSADGAVELVSRSGKWRLALSSDDALKVYVVDGVPELLDLETWVIEALIDLGDPEWPGPERGVEFLQIEWEGECRAWLEDESVPFGHAVSALGHAIVLSLTEYLNHLGPVEA